MHKNLYAVVIMAICPSLIAQQPLSVSAPSQDQQTPSVVAPAASADRTAPVQLPPSVTLLDGTAVKLKISQTISSEEAKTGQEIPFEVLEDVNVSGVSVIKKGDSAFGTVTNAVPKKMMGRGGKLDLSINYVRLVDQEKVPLKATKESKGHGNTVGMTVGIAATAVLFFPAAPLFLLMHGKDVTIPQGTEVTAYVQGDIPLDVAKFGVTPPSIVSVVASAPATITQASLAIDSAPTGADIEIDGVFVGNTPSTVSVASGTHEVAVKKDGFPTWSKSLNISGGTVHLSADLEQALAAR